MQIKIKDTLKEQKVIASRMSHGEEWGTELFLYNTCTILFLNYMHELL